MKAICKVTVNARDENYTAGSAHRILILVAHKHKVEIFHQILYEVYFVQIDLQLNNTVTITYTKISESKTALTVTRMTFPTAKIVYMY